MTPVTVSRLANLKQYGLMYNVGTCSEHFSECNSALEQCMNEQCAVHYKDRLLKEIICDAYSELVHAALDLLGGIAWDKSTEKHCECVEE